MNKPTLNTDTIEQIIADKLFARHGQILINGKVDGTNVGLDFVKEVSGGRGSGISSWRPAYNGKIQIRVGSDYYPNRSVGFREKKDGTHNYEKIADKLNEMHEKILTQQNRQDQKKILMEQNNRANKDIAAKHGISEYSTHLHVNWETGALTFKTYSISREQAASLVQCAIDNGIIKTS